jgi:hypothetical protein
LVFPYIWLDKLFLLVFRILSLSCTLLYSDYNVHWWGYYLVEYSWSPLSFIYLDVHIYEDLGNFSAIIPWSSFSNVFPLLFNFWRNHHNVKICSFNRSHKSHRLSSFFFLLQYWGLNSGPISCATPPAIFVIFFSR